MTKPDKERSAAIKLFLDAHNFTDEEFGSCGLTWEQLQAIAEQHRIMSQELLSVGRFVSDCLQQLKEIHSLKLRVKNPDGLAAKIVRKRLEQRDIDQSDVPPLIRHAA